jgi:hypothetical protein
MGRCWAAVSATLLVAGCYTGLEGFDPGDDPGTPPGAADDAGDDAGADAGDDDGGEPDAPDAPCRTAGRTATRLLTAAEYENSVRRLLGVDTEVQSRLPIDDVVGELFTHNGAAELDAGEVRKYMLVAEDLAAEVAVVELLPCEPGDGAATQQACAEAFVRELGRKAYRRPLTDEEVARWLEVYLAARDDEAIVAGFNEAIRTVIAGMLQSPGFLMLTERGEVREDTPEGLLSLTSHELATKLAYLVWDDLPDDELAALADAGTLADPDVLEAQARRMLADPRARRAVLAFFRQWLRTDAVLGSDNIDPSLLEPMARETALLAEHVLWGDDAEGTLDELLTADYTFVNAELAAHYGLPAAGLGDEASRVALPDERMGVLGHGSLLAAFGEHSTTIYRGLHVYRDMMCRTTAPPPDVLDTGMFGHLDPRAAAEARIDNETCNPCHGKFETVGLALEDFDATGRFREAYPDGQPVDASGSWPAPNAQEFAGLAELSAELAASEEVERCAAQRATEFAFGPDAQQIPGEARSCVVEPIQEAFVQSGGDLRELVVSLVKSDAFRLRDPGPETPTCE